ncbi:histidine kinase-like ATPase [Chytriomyces sp. MP71]|nr:histidine kinase-like ATPase [Chytriomyces sp. MP71]
MIRHHPDQKTSFMAFLCHELRNPLHALVNVSSLVRESLTLTHEQNELFDAIEASASYMSELINDVLDTSKFEAGKMKLEYLPVDFKKLVQVVTLPLRESLRARNVDFTCIVDNIPAIISIDPTRIKQVIVNLLSNAVKFTSNGGSITCAFSCERISNCTQDMQLKFYVKDSGIGMADNVVKNLFVPFHQAHVSTTREYGGTGLGLAICKKIVDLMGGKIIVTSVKNVGTTFSVEIPVVADTEGKMAAIDIEHDPHAVRLGVLTSDESMGAHVTTLSLQKTEPRSRKSEEIDVSPSVIGSVYSNDEMPCLPRIDHIFAENFASAPRSIRSITRHSSISNPREAVQLMAVHNMMRSSKIHSRRGSFVFSADDAEDDDEVELNARSSPKTSKMKNGSNNSSSGASSLVPTHSRRMSLSTEVTVELSPVFQLPSLQSPQDQTVRFMSPPADLGARSILVVDDSAINRKILVKFLKTLGSFMIDEAIHGLDAIERIKTNGCSYSIIFMDLSMPVMGGREATEILKRELNVTAPIVAVTGDNLPDDELAKLTEAGFSGVQPKPFTREHIEKYLRSLKS